MSRKQEERSELTRNALLEAGRRLFGRQGFAETSIEQIVREADVTRGALYHHFNGKLELFVAVSGAMEAEVIQNALLKASEHEDPWDQIEAGLQDFLDRCTDKEVQQIVVHDGPAVLGWERWHDAENRAGMQQVFTHLSLLEGIDRLPPTVLDVAANIFVGALMEAAKTIAKSDDPKLASQAAGYIISQTIRVFHANLEALIQSAPES